MHVRGILVSAAALGWTLFQLTVVTLPINDTLVRSIHLAFALFLAFLLRDSNPVSADQGPSRARWLQIADFILAGAGALSASYLAYNYQAIASRPGIPSLGDIIASVICVLILLEATRRALGLALTVMAIVFLGYCYFGPLMPDVIAHRGAGLEKLASHMYLGTEGIFGVPIRVSSSFVFLFVLFGAVLEKSGAGQYFIDLAYAALGHFRGGPAKAAVAASGLLGMISGSSIANTVTTGTFTIPLMKKNGFSAEKAAAVEVAASTNAQLMPPVMGAAAFIMSEFLGISYLEVVKAAAIPAFISYIGLFAVVHFEALKLNLPVVPRRELPPFWSTLVLRSYYLLPIVFLLYALIVQRQSATLAAFKATLVAMGILLIRSYVNASGKALGRVGKASMDLLRAGIDGAKNMVPIAIATASAGIITGTITLTGLGQSLLELISSISGGNFPAVLLLTALTCLILGMGLPTTANYIVMASLSAPILVNLASDQGIIIPLIAIHLFVFYFGILADDTPPVGLAAYSAAAIAKSDPIKTGIQGFTYDLRTAVLPFMFLFNTRLLLIDGVVEGGNPMHAADWIWYSSWWSIASTFIVSAAAMLFFVSAVTGYWHRALNWFERGIMLFCFLVLIRLDWLNQKTTLPVYLLLSGVILLVALPYFLRFWYRRRKMAS